MNGAPDIEDQILRLLDGELPPAESEALAAVLLHDPAARATYEELVLLHNSLESRFGTESANAPREVVPIRKIISLQNRRVLRSSLAAAAAVILISAIVMWRVLAPSHSEGFALLKTSSDAVVSFGFSGEGEAPERGTLGKGSSVSLEEGMLETTFQSGVRLIAEAPCELRVLAEDRIALDEGVAWFHVPAGAEGFTVRTPKMIAVDLGTEFGLVSHPNASTELHVIKGSVEATFPDSSLPTTILGAGEARRIQPDGTLKAIPAEATRFETRLMETRQAAIANHSFEADVIPRDGDRTTKDTGKDDYNKKMIPSGWTGFDDGKGKTRGETVGVLSTAPDSHFSETLARTPDDDANDQMFYTAAMDIHQVLDERLRPNTTYVLSADIGDRKVNDAGGNPGTPGLHLGVGTKPESGRLTPVSSETPDHLDGGWVTWTLVYKTGPDPEGAGQPLRIELTTGSRVAWFDRVRLAVKQ